jgi:molecular chaperone GrpE
LSNKKREREAEVVENESSAEAGQGGEAGSLQSALDEAQAEVAELKEKLLRLHAEIENVRKRARREAEDASKFAVEKFAAALLDVADNLERALESSDENSEALREGVQLTLNGWHETMKKFGIERVDAMDQKFDPHLHEALAQVPHDAESGKVVSQHVAGYTLHGRLLRPARVIVSSGPAEEKRE